MIYNFTSVPQSALVPGPEGSFYVLNDTGAGQMLQLLPPAQPGGAWTSVVLYWFGRGKSASSSPNWLMPGPNGSLYGASRYGGGATGGGGTVFQLTPPPVPGGFWHETVLHGFNPGEICSGLGYPVALASADDGTLYGLSQQSDCIDVADKGGVFSLTPPASPGGKWQYSILLPIFNFYLEFFSTTIVQHNGNLFFDAQTPTGGYVLEMQPPSAPGGAWKTIQLFGSTNGAVPSQLYIDAHGTLFGITGLTDPPGQVTSGTVYMITGIAP